jgi:hypothetical protein
LGEGRRGLYSAYTGSDSSPSITLQNGTDVIITPVLGSTEVQCPLDLGVEFILLYKLGE